MELRCEAVVRVFDFFLRGIGGNAQKFVVGEVFESVEEIEDASAFFNREVAGFVELGRVVEGRGD